jgi:hypothetical protein
MKLTFEKFCEVYPLLEMPNVFPTEVNPEYINKYLIQYIKEGLANNAFIPTSSINIFSYPKSKTESIYIMINGLELIGGASFKVTTYCGVGYITPTITKKFIDTYPQVALNIYKVAYHNFGCPIVSDSSQSVHASAMWINPSNYGITSLRVIDVTKEDCKTLLVNPEDIWDYSNKEHILISIKF